MLKEKKDCLRRKKNVCLKKRRDDLSGRKRFNERKRGSKRKIKMIRKRKRGSMNQWQCRESALYSCIATIRHI